MDSSHFSLTELQNIARESNVKGFSTYRTKHALMKLLSDKNLLPEYQKVSERLSRLRNKVYNPKQVTVEFVNTGEIITFPSIYRASVELDLNPNIIRYWNEKIYKNMYKFTIHE